MRTATDVRTLKQLAKKQKPSKYHNFMIFLKSQGFDVVICKFITNLDFYEKGDTIHLMFLYF